MSCGKPVEEVGLITAKEDLKTYLFLGGLSLGLKLSAHQIEQFIYYLNMIKACQNKVNITSIEKPVDIINKHFLDSLTSIGIMKELLERNYFKKGIRIIDVGTGAGLPGIPIKIVWPNIRMSLLDARKNKAIFLKEVIDNMNLEGTEVIVERVENVGRSIKFREKYSIVVSRAVAELAVLCEYCLPLCRVGGVMLAFKGSSYQDELRSSLEAIDRLGGVLRSINTIKIPNENYFRYILVIDKIKPTSEDYPRKDGIPLKRPLYFK